MKLSAKTVKEVIRNTGLSPATLAIIANNAPVTIKTTNSRLHMVSALLPSEKSMPFSTCFSEKWVPKEANTVSFSSMKALSPDFPSKFVKKFENLVV